jgi:diguanylate cyclase (GGDEF)-like protein/PAS domain S-box-containing protein
MKISARDTLGATLPVRATCNDKGAPCQDKPTAEIVWRRSAFILFAGPHCVSAAHSAGHCGTLPKAIQSYSATAGNQVPPFKLSGSDLMEESSLLKAILDSSTDYSIIVADRNGIIKSWNAGAEQITGFDQHEVVGKSLDFLFPQEDCAHNAPQKERDAAQYGGRYADQRWLLRKDGSRFWADSVTTPIKDAGGDVVGFLKILRDHTEKMRADEEILTCARLDALTGLANRASFKARLAEMVASTLRSGQLLILQMIDLDYFKEVNDTLGHHTGDELLQQAAQRMRSVTRDTDFIARIGGDEFVVLQPNAHSPEVGGSLANKLLDVLSKPYQIDGHEVSSGASIGVAVCPQDASEPEQLLKKADLALYRVKKTGRGGFSCFTEHLDEEAHKRNRDLSELRRAVAEHAFWLAYQPKVDGLTGAPIALEALLRCDNALLSTYPIDHVIALAREAGLMPRIGAWVLAQACTQARQWQDAGLPHIRVCVNICTRELMDPEICRQIGMTLERSGLQPGHLEIEVTEAQLFDSKEQGVANLKALRARGTLIAIDDFGSGYSSLSYLRWLPVDSLKLDRTFLPSVPQDAQGSAIARGVINLAHSLKLDVIAEGVESAEQVEFLRKERCEQLQGYYFSRPLDAAAMTSWLMKRSGEYSATARPSRVSRE